MPSAKQIAAAQVEIWRTVLDDATTEAEAARTCWGCGEDAPGFKPTRAHIVARSQQGTNEPSNFLLLCDPCHAEQPDGAPFEVQMLWLRQDRIWRRRILLETHAVVDAIKAAAATRGGDATIQAWMECAGSVGHLLLAGENRRAGEKNRSPNAKWHLVTAFIEWADARASAA